MVRRSRRHIHIYVSDNLENLGTTYSLDILIEDFALDMVGSSV